jgi:hypothetical protein
MVPSNDGPHERSIWDFGLEDLRGGVETISSPTGKIDRTSTVNPPGTGEYPNAKVN